MSVVSRLLGHGSTDVTEKVYAKFLPETLSAEVARAKSSFRRATYAVGGSGTSERGFCFSRNCLMNADGY